MRYQKKYHPRSFLPKMVAGSIWHKLVGIPYAKNDLLVLNYHSTPAWLIPEFEKQILFFRNHFRFVSPQFLKTYYGNGATEDGPYLLFSFDDGLNNNLYAADVLEKYQTRGLFFIVPEFTRQPPEAGENYYRTHIRQLVNPHLDFMTEDVTPMNASALNKLISRGHVMGSHSLTHTMKASDDEKKCYEEVVKSKQELEQLTGTEVEHFCAPFNSLISTSTRQMQLIRSHYSFYHSTLPGSNLKYPDPFFIRRVNVECFWPLPVTEFAISGFEWWRWADKVQKFREVAEGKQLV